MRRFSGLGPGVIVMCTNGSLIDITEHHPVNLSDMIYLTKLVLKFSYLLPGSLALMWAMRIAQPAFLVLLEHTVELKATALHAQQVCNMNYLH